MKSTATEYLVKKLRKYMENLRFDPERLLAEPWEGGVRGRCMIIYWDEDPYTAKNYEVCDKLYLDVDEMVKHRTPEAFRAYLEFEIAVMRCKG